MTKIRKKSSIGRRASTNDVKTRCLGQLARPNHVKSRPIGRRASPNDVKTRCLGKLARPNHVKSRSIGIRASPKHVKTRCLGRLTRHPHEFLRENGAGVRGDPKSRTLRSKGRVERRPKSRTLSAKGTITRSRLNYEPCAQSEALDLVPHSIEPKSSRNVIKNRCFESVFGSLPTESLISSVGLGYMAVVQYLFPKTV